MKEILSEKILRYPWLSKEEQRQIQEEVRRRAPEWQELLDGIQQLTPLLESLHLPAEDPMSEEMLAFYLLTRRLSPHPLPPSLAAYFSRLETRLETEPALQKRYKELAHRMEQLLQRFDARAHFEQLTGYKLQEQEREPFLVGGNTSRDSHPAVFTAPDRPARQATRQNVWRWVERGAFFVMVLSVLYGGLFLWSRTTYSELERLGFISPALLEVDRYRGEAPVTGSPDVLYEEALQTIAKAHTSWLGLFPRYDGARLAHAESLLVAVVTNETTTFGLRQEALFLIGKVRLLRHNVEGARQALQEVAAQESPFSEEAQRLLRKLPCPEEPAQC